MNLIALINWSMRMFVLSETQVRNSEVKIVQNHPAWLISPLIT